MALGTAHMTTTTHTKFIPELWSDEVVAAYKSNLVLANLVTRMNHSGKKGDTIHIPKPTRGAASAKAASTEVTLIAATETELTISIDKHFEYSRMIEDILEKQALSSMRTFILMMLVMRLLNKRILTFGCKLTRWVVVLSTLLVLELLLTLVLLEL